MTGRDPRPEKVRDYRRQPFTGLRCMSHIPPLSKPAMIPGGSGFPVADRPRCGQTRYLRTRPGVHGQMLVWCPIRDHKEDVEAQDTPYHSAVAEFGERVHHELEEATR